MKTTGTLIWLLALALLGLVLLALSAPTARAADPVIVRVTTSGTTTWPCGDQSNWSNPCALQTALSNTVSGTELWVAAGAYKPTVGTERTATFQLRDGIALYGGFVGGETLRTQRNFTANVTILSGDIGAPSDSSDNSYHVVTGRGVTNTAVLNGFTVTGGRANGAPYPDDSGGGMYIAANSSPLVINVIFDSNNANGLGGGIYNESNSSPMLNNVTFISNTADYGGGMANSMSSSATLSNVTFNGNSAWSWGGGMFNSDSNPTLSNINFISNTAYNRGGGMYNVDSSPVLANVTFSGNSADFANGVGGGMFNQTGSPVLANVTFSGNSAWIGGGLHGFDSSLTLNNVAFIGNMATGTGACGGLASGGRSLTLTNATFSGNSASYGGGMCAEGNSMALTNVTFSGNSADRSGGAIENYQGSPTLTNVTFSGNSAGWYGGGIYNRVNSNPTLRNAIFWANTGPSDSQIGNDDTSKASVSDSVVQGGYAGGTNIVTADPRLGVFGNWGGSTQTVPLLPGSSAIDAGNDTYCPPTDQRGAPRPQGAHCDIGAFEAERTRLNLPLIRR